MDLHYHLKCSFCGKVFQESDGLFLLGCDENHTPSLLRTVYKQRAFTIDSTSEGLFRYAAWLPVQRKLASSAFAAVYRSKYLAAKLRLANLIIAFSGYWPERGASMETCSFKELEALAVCARLPVSGDRPLVVASAGNTARAFLQVGSQWDVPVIAVVPEFALSRIWTTIPIAPLAKLLVLDSPADYVDAIEYAETLAQSPGFCAVGGAHNVARRDGLGTILLRAVEQTGEIPRHYVQAVGSGTGALGVWEMNRRLIADGRFGGRMAQLHLVQNAPLAHMASAWNDRRRHLALIDAQTDRLRMPEMHAQVLANRNPAYTIVGGVFDALSETGGNIYTVSKAEALAAGRMFEEFEGCDLEPAAEVALAGLIVAIRTGAIEPAESILLHLSGGGARLMMEHGKHPLPVPVGSWPI